MKRIRCCVTVEVCCYCWVCGSIPSSMTTNNVMLITYPVPVMLHKSSTSTRKLQNILEQSRTIQNESQRWSLKSTYTIVTIASTPDMQTLAKGGGGGYSMVTDMVKKTHNIRGSNRIIFINSSSGSSF